ncbi:LPXTG cell wall anchor domain-containing protein [Streptococcus mitis]|nr:LPXTG cell wall anchor domain-containing protein [Streptococcus mitis]
MKTKSAINLFATAILAIATIGSNTIYADAQINRDTANDSVEIISDPYKTYEEADKALNDVKDKYLEEYGSYRAGVVPTEDLKNYEVYAIIRKVSLDETAEKTVQNVAKALSNSKSTEPVKPVEEEKPVTPTKPAEEVKPETPAKPVEEVKPETPAKPVEDIKPETPTKPAEEVKPVTPAKPAEDTKPVTPTKPVEDIKPETPTKPVEDIKPETPTKPAEDTKPVTPTNPADEGKTSNDIQEIKGKFTEIKTTSTGLTFKAKLPEAAPHAGPVLPNIQATLTDKATGKEVAKTSVVLEGLSEEFKKSDALLYSNLLEGTIFEPSLTSGNYILTVEGTTGPTYGQNTDKRKRHFVFSTEVTLTGEGNATTTTQPEKPKDSTTKPKSDHTTNNVNNNQQPNNDKNKQSTNNNTGKQDKNELSTNKNSDTKADKQNSDNTLSQEKQQATSTSTTKPENNKNNDKKTLPNTGESRSTLGIIGTVLSITVLGFIVKRKRG